jgi:Lon protease-like protein
MAEYDRLPIFGLHTALFPQMSLPLHVFEPRYRLLVARCLEGSEPFGIALLKSGADVEAFSREPFVPHSVGTLARITRCEWQPDGRAHLEVVGETRFLIAETFSDQPYMTARVTPFWEQSCDPLDLQPLFDEVSNLFRAYFVKLLEATQRPVSGFQLPGDPVLLSFAVANLLPIPAARKQQLLATRYTDARLREELEILQTEREVLESVAKRAAVRSRSGRSADPAQANASAIVMQVDGAALRRYLSKN